MPTRKNINKSKGATDFGPTVEDDEWDAKSMTSLSENAGSSSQLATTPADMAPDLDVIQRLEMRSDFATKFLNAIHDVKRDVWDFSGRMDEAEERISKVEDAVYTEKGKTEELIKQVDLLKHKLDDLENRSRRSNLRLVNWSRKVWRNRFSRETATWSSATFPSPPVIERAHRIPTGAQNTWFPRPRVLIIKFLNLQDKVQAMRAARTKGKILYGEQEVMFFRTYLQSYSDRGDAMTGWNNSWDPWIFATGWCTQPSFVWRPTDEHTSSIPQQTPRSLAKDWNSPVVPRRPELVTWKRTLNVAPCE